VLTFDELLRRTPLARRLTAMLKILEKHYGSPVDTEFTVRVVDANTIHRKLKSHCCSAAAKPPARKRSAAAAEHPRRRHHFFHPTHGPEGWVSEIRFVLFVPPEGYYSLPTAAARGELGRVIGQLNAALKKVTFICLGPGRWGTSTPDLGVRVAMPTYTTRARWLS